MGYRIKTKKSSKTGGTFSQLALLARTPRIQFGVLALIVIALTLVLGPVSKPLVDSALYADLARNLVQTGQFNENFQPSTQNFLFPLILAGFMAIFGTTGTAWIHAYLAISALALLGSFWLLAKVTIGEQNAFYALAVFLAVPIVANVGLDLLTDAPFLVFAMLSATAYLKWLDEDAFSKETPLTVASLSAFFSNPLVLAWVAFAVLASWTRNTGFLLPVIFGLHMAWTQWFGKADAAKKARKLIMAKRFALGIVLILAMSAAWNIRNVMSWLGDSSGHYANVLQQPALGHIGVHIVDGKKVFELFETRMVDGIPLVLNTPIHFALPAIIPIPPILIGNADVPIFLAYLLRLVIYLFIFIGPVLVLFGARMAWHVIRPASYNIPSRQLVSPTVTFLAAWFFIFAAFHVLWPAAFSLRYVAPLAVPLALCFGSAAGNRLRNEHVGPSKKPFFSSRFWAVVFIAQLAFSAAVISWDMKTRWAPSNAAANGLETTGAWIEAHVPAGKSIQVAGVPQNAISFYGNRKAMLQNGEFIAFSNYLDGNMSAVSGLPKCFEYQNAYWTFAVYSKTICP